jgi:probable HAF family extracellular repeat protein
MKFPVFLIPPEKDLHMHISLKNCFFLIALFSSNAYAATHSLGISTSSESIAYDMNANGQVAAVIMDDEGNQHAVFFEHGVLTEIGTLGGKDSDAKRINNKGEIVGSANQKDGSWRAFLYNRTTGMQMLDTLGGTNSHGTALNNAGTVVGFADTASKEWHAFLAQRGEVPQDLGTLGGQISYAAAINNKGQVVGAATLPNEYRHAFFYEPARGMIDLGTLGGRSSYATSINDNGTVAGASEMADRSWHAFVYDGHRLTDLGKLIGQGNSFATGINNAGHVVGTYVNGDTRLSFVWRDNKMTLHQSGAKGLYLTNAINNAEQVIGATYDRGLDAATMLSSAAPYVDRGGSNLFSRIMLVLIIAGTAVIWRRRYKGILLAGYADLRSWTR